MSEHLRRKEIRLHGHPVSYREAGSGPVLLLVHGITSSSGAWSDVVPALSERHTVVAPDLLGHGGSAKPRGDYSLGAYASGLRDLLAALGHQRATVVGHSMGAASPCSSPISSPSASSGWRWSRAAVSVARSGSRSAPRPCRAPSGCCR